MENHYSHLSSEERNTIQRGLNERLSKRAIARLLNRAPSTVTREISRCIAQMAPQTRPAHRAASIGYDAARAAQVSRACRRRGPRKLAEGTPLRAAVIEQLHDGWSPEQIAGRLRSMNPDQPEAQVCHETIYAAIYATPRGELRKSLISQLRQAHKQRLPRSRGQDRRGHLPDMVSIHDRPEEVTDRRVPGHWEGDLIKGAGNRSAVARRRTNLPLRHPGQDGWHRRPGRPRWFYPPSRPCPSRCARHSPMTRGKEMAAMSNWPSAWNCASLPILTASGSAHQRKRQRPHP